MPESQPTPKPPDAPSTRRRPVPGRGHCKSRKGCFSCRHRRVKCSEERPACRACQRLGLDCQYPPPRRLLLTSAATSPGPGTPVPLPAAVPSAVLRFEDLRFFHHFLTAAYPPLPFGLAHVWQDVAAMAHEYDFLAHAVLALAAQHLSSYSSSSTGTEGKGGYALQALDHRVSAMSKLNAALSAGPCRTRADGDARVAAAVVLTFQSSHMPEGMMEFLSLLRGWMVIQTAVVPSMEGSLFCGFREEMYVESMRSLLGEVKGQGQGEGGGDDDEELQTRLEDFGASLRVVAALCRTPAEVRYLAAMERFARLSRTSPVDACLELVPFYAVTNEMDPDEFADFTKPTNFTAQILLTHFWMLTLVLQRHVLGPARAFAVRDDVVLQWVERAAQQLPESHKRYVLWPLGMARVWKTCSGPGRLRLGA